MAGQGYSRGGITYVEVTIWVSEATLTRSDRHRALDFTMVSPDLLKGGYRYRMISWMIGYIIPGVRVEMS